LSNPAAFSRQNQLYHVQYRLARQVHFVGGITLANIKSQIKRNRQNEKRRLRNRDFRGAARTAVKDARASLESKQNTQASVMAAVSALDIAAQKGAVHPRNAARRKSRLMKLFAALGLQPKSSVTEPAIPVVEKKEAEKKSGKVEKESKPPVEEKTKAESKKAAAKSTPKKPSEKKPAAKSATKKAAGKK
jgi:small subunit ribosomal protein S20